MKAFVSNFKPVFPIIPILTVALLSGCGEGWGFPSETQTPEAVCATYPDSNYGHAFYCGSAQGNLWTVDFPDGSHGYCMYANENLGLVGYSATTYNGGATFVMSQSNASNASRDLGSNSPGYTRCTRE